MNISSIQGVSSLFDNMYTEDSKKLTGANTETFEALLNSAMGMIQEAEDATNQAEQAELEYMLGLNDSVTDLLVAQEKANMAIQYTVAVKNAVTQAYQEIMQIQF
ncbi:MAG: flagellar hook-basal body complex protein FliE [Lachnospiraceae bacterium]|nr:flagellar hook-basal body complex protein FliE [Lachnospiraceae bacterium]MBP3611394.1 flagellar hook-basal body complex protein FliE [Lachnospiraceae bacterium]